MRTATPDDVGDIERIVRAAFAPYVARIGREPAPMTADYHRVVAHTDDAYVLVDQGGTVGVLIIVEKADHLLIETLAVDAACQGLGYGKVLLTFAENQARERGYMQTRLYTNAAMTENLAFYPYLGYVEVGRRAEDGFERVYFTKDLATIVP